MGQLTSVLLTGAVVITSPLMAHPGDAEIQRVSVLGRACGVDSAATAISSDGQAVTVIFDQFQAELTESQDYARTFCRVNLDVRVPPGWSFTVLGVDYRGYVSLDPATEANHWLAYGFGANMMTFQAQSFVGPVDDDYRHYVELPTPTQGVFSPCGSTANLTRLRLHNVLELRGSHAAQAYIGVDSIDGEFRQPLQLKLFWQPCG